MANETARAEARERGRQHGRLAQGYQPPVEDGSAGFYELHHAYWLGYHEGKDPEMMKRIERRMRGQGA